jgi:hypothetical protein
MEFLTPARAPRRVSSLAVPRSLASASSLGESLNLRNSAPVCRGRVLMGAQKAPSELPKSSEDSPLVPHLWQGVSRTDSECPKTGREEPSHPTMDSVGQVLPDRVRGPWSTSP